MIITRQNLELLERNEEAIYEHAYQEISSARIAKLLTEDN